VVADRQLCNRFTPGTRVSVVGIYSTIKSKDKNASALLQPYLRAVSMVEEAGDSHSRFNFTQEEITKFERFSKTDRIHEMLFAQIAPNIFGADEIKKAVASLLFGGSRKMLPDGTSRRGDINVLLLGDPSTAKSQFLKFASKVAPISVYTSGKGSSAAGLTATVVQDANTREFYLEGGAMVLADNGVVCIDEFDKMRPEDRVAIHEVRSSSIEPLYGS
jgi:DNA replication licensing factor MCM5